MSDLYFLWFFGWLNPHGWWAFCLFIKFNFQVEAMRTPDWWDKGVNHIFPVKSGFAACVNWGHSYVHCFACIINLEFTLFIQWCQEQISSLTAAAGNFFSLCTSGSAFLKKNIFCFNFFFPSFHFELFCLSPRGAFCDPSKHDIRTEWICSESSCQCELKLDPSPWSAFDL